MIKRPLLREYNTFRQNNSTVIQLILFYKRLQHVYIIIKPKYYNIRQICIQTHYTTPSNTTIRPVEALRLF